MMNNKWVSFSPHILSKNSTVKTYITMIILLCPVFASTVVTFDFMPLLTVLVSILSALVADMLFKLVVDKRYDFQELSAVFIGLVIGLCMPTGTSVFVPILGTMISVIFIRDIAGGIGQNFVSEIAVAVVLSSLIYTADFYMFRVAGTTRVMGTGFLDQVLSGTVTSIDITALLFGGTTGLIAETSMFWLLIAGILMLVFRLIDFRVPVATLASTFVFALIFFDVVTAVNLMFTGGVVISAFFIATDYAVVPKNKWAKYIYGLLIGFLTVIIWKAGSHQMAVFYAVIIMGLVSSMVNGLTRTLKNRRV